MTHICCYFKFFVRIFFTLFDIIIIKLYELLIKSNALTQLIKLNQLCNHVPIRTMLSIILIHSCHEAQAKDKQKNQI